MKKRHLTEVQDWMRENPVTIDPDATLAAAQELMIENEVRRLPVVERGELVGIITNSDILRQIPSHG
jgi:CBS domain-containing protein